MKIEVTRVPVQEILPLRELHRAEMRCQIVHDSLHERGLTHPYLLRLDGEVVGYGTVFGLGDEPKETVDELFVLGAHRSTAPELFRALVAESGATRVRAQTNDPLLIVMLFDCAAAIERDAILFEDGFTSSLGVPGVEFRRAAQGDEWGTKEASEAGDWVLERSGEIVGIGGVLLHYNPPYGDLYMEVAEPHRRRGFGSFLVQELKRACYDMGKVPAARCAPTNSASRATLQRAGMLPCGSILIGEITR